MDVNALVSDLGFLYELYALSLPFCFATFLTAYGFTGPLMPPPETLSRLWATLPSHVWFLRLLFKIHCRNQRNPCCLPGKAPI